MRTSTIFATVALLSSTALAAPPRLPTHYFRRCDNETHAPAPAVPAPAPSCDLTSLSQPDNILAPPAEGLELVMIALGQGTQNYTCGANTTAAPTAIGALATLYDASCALLTDPQMGTKSLSAEAKAQSIGMHYFVDNTTPDFEIAGMGNTQLKKVEECAAPAPAADVKWLRLEAQAATSTSSVKQIYRLHTVGGLAPGSCQGMKQGDVVTVEYEAQYWIYA